MPVNDPADFALASADKPRLWANVPGPGRDARRSLIKGTMEQTYFISTLCADIQVLAAAVIFQSGGWGTFQEMAPDVADHGIDGGFHGWIYHSETVRFYEENRKEIAGFLISLSRDCGVDTVEMIKQWRCMEGATDLEIMATLSGAGEPDTTVANGLSWCVAEEICRRFVDAKDG